MKRFIISVMSLIMVTGFIGCQNPDEINSLRGNDSTDVQAVLEEKMKEADIKNDVSSEDNKDTKGAADVEKTMDASDSEGVVLDDIKADPGSTTSGNLEQGSTVSTDTASGNLIGFEISAEAKELAAGTEGVDVDLTVLSATMVYAEVYNMMVLPEDYMGKTIRMEGLMSYYYDQASDKRYFACIVQDATACCSQGIEFELTDDYLYPEDYPEDGENIVVEGTFDMYEEDGCTYATLRNARLV